jgi:hypothetical protein
LHTSRRTCHHLPVVVTDETLAEMPRWDPVRLAGLPGRSRGDLLGPWGHSVARRFGPDALARVRRRLAPPLDQIAPVLGAGDWLPVHAQLVVTEAIVDEFLGGDLRALRTPLLEDTRAGLGRVQLLAVRALGPGRAIRIAHKDFGKVHERGEVGLEIESHHARLTFRGTPLFGHPTWRLLQLYALLTLLELTHRPGTAVGEELGPDGFVAIARW